jgi:hypothetical protein
MEPRWVRPLWRLLGSPRGAEAASRRFLAFVAVACLVGAAILAWVSYKYDPVVEIPAFDAVLWIIGLKSTWDYFALKREEGSERQSPQ